jgi:hypothetical protein
MLKAISEAQAPPPIQDPANHDPLKLNIDCMKEDWEEPDPEEKMSYRET